MRGDDGSSWLSRSSIRLGVAGGLLHGAIAVVLWNHWFDDLGAMVAVKPLVATYLVIGSFVLGVVPVAAFVGRRVVSPAVIVAVLLGLAVIGSWLTGPVGAPSATPTPFALYLLSWVGIVVLVGLTGRWEARRGHRADA